jgi:hypothetical protein
VQLSDDDSRNAYVLTWVEHMGAVKIKHRLWLDKDSYAPLRFTDHSSGKDYKGRPFDQTYVETIDDFQRLPDTPENRKLLELR